MISVSFITSSSEVFEAQAELGQSLMAVALSHGVPGVLGDCGGAAACGTCHILVPESFWEIVGAPAPGEDALLSSLADRKPHSRLACQVKVVSSMHGLCVEVLEVY